MHRDLLRRAGIEGFTVYVSEWWHFDYRDGGEDAILNVPSKARLGPRVPGVHDEALNEFWRIPL